MGTLLSASMANEFQLGGILPWGRTAAEYRAFFQLQDVPSGARILDCGGGPSSFTAEWGEQGGFAVAADPLFARSSDEIAEGFDDVAARMLDGMRAARARFNWNHYPSPEAVVEQRRRALKRFRTDLSSPQREGGYVASSLPNLPFSDGSFDLALSSHLLFLYSEELDLTAHIAALTEMLRVSDEVRVFPLIEMNGEPSRHVEPTLEHFGSRAICEVVEVPFEFQRGGNRMLRLKTSTS